MPVESTNTNTIGILSLIMLQRSINTVLDQYDDLEMKE